MTVDTDQFKSLAIASLLDIDPRPTIVLDLLLPDDQRIVYQNPAFQVVKYDVGQEISKLGVKNTPEGALEVPATWIDRTDRLWTTITLQERWILSSRNSDLVCAGARPNASALDTSERLLSQTQPSLVHIREPDLVHVDRNNTKSDADLLGLTRFSSELTDFDRLLLAIPWHSTSLGSIITWPVALLQAVSFMLRNSEPRLLIWGPERILIYNEACAPVFGLKHPAALGARTFDIWAELEGLIAPSVTSAIDEGLGSKFLEMPIPFMRHGFLEECFFNFGFVTIVGSDHRGNGAFDEFIEVSKAVIDRRRQQTIHEINSLLKTAENLEDAWSRFADGLRSNVNDIPYAIFYSVSTPTTSDSDHTSSSADQLLEPKSATFQVSLGADPEQLGLSRYFTVDSSSSSPLVQAIAKAQSSGTLVYMQLSDGTLPQELEIAVPDRAWNDKIKAICIVPFSSTLRYGPAGFAVLGVNPRQAIDERMDLFFNVLADTFCIMTTLVSLPEQTRRQKVLFQDLESTLTERVKAHALQSERLEARFTRMAHSAPIGMYIMNPVGKPIFFNDTYVRILGATRAEVEKNYEELGFNWWRSYVLQEDHARVEKSFMGLLVNSGPVSFEYKINKTWHSLDQSTGLPITGPTVVMAHSVPEFDEEGKIVQVMGWLLDISQEKFTQRLLSERLEEAQEAKRQSENFIDMTSHEMRNPLSAILQSADGILTSMQESGSRSVGDNTNVTPGTSDSIVDAAQTIILCAQHQKRIVDDVLTFSKLDSNLLVISPDKTRPSLLLDRALRMYESELERASIKAQVTLLPGFLDLDVDFVMLDSSRILQVIINLLTNAIKFTQYAQKREINIGLDASLTKPSASVDEDVVFIPQRASRPEHHFTTEWGNGQTLYLHFTVRDSGLGLSPDEKSLLFQRFSQASPKTYKQYGGSGLGLFISRELTELQGGQIGVSSEEGKGCSFAFYVKARRWVPSTPAPEYGNGKLDFRSSIMSDNPVAYTRRGSVQITETTPQKSSPMGKPSPARSSNDSDATQLHVLIVEDNIINQKVMAKQVRTAGHIVHVANHGVEALDFIRRTAFWNSDMASSGNVVGNGASNDLIPLSVVLMDQEMPVMDGLTCVRRIREMEKDGTIISHIPVIAVTANARSEQIGILLGAGMDEVVTKPFRIPTVVERAKKLVAEIEAVAGLVCKVDALGVVVDEVYNDRIYD